jgi:type I restriction enzyme M protein
MSRILDPAPGMSAYDPCAGSLGLLIKCHLRLLEKYGKKENGRKLPSEIHPLMLDGQEINPSTFAMAKMNAFIHEMQGEVALGDTMNHPRFVEDGRLKRCCDLVAANPMWNQKFSSEVYEHDPYERFSYGLPPSSSADWGWVQHMLSSLNEGGRMAVVLDTGAVSRGSGNTGSNKERDIRKAFVEGSAISEGDLIEAVILLPGNLFCNTTAPGIILISTGRSPIQGRYS